jgi:hypothetical protein
LQDRQKLPVQQNGRPALLVGRNRVEPEHDLIRSPRREWQTDARALGIRHPERQPVDVWLRPPGAEKHRVAVAGLDIGIILAGNGLSDNKPRKQDVDRARQCNRCRTRRAPGQLPPSDPAHVPSPPQ